MRTRAVVGVVVSSAALLSSGACSTTDDSAPGPKPSLDAGDAAPADPCAGNAGGAPVQVASIPDAPATFGLTFAVNDAYLYWTAQLDGRTYEAPIGGGGSSVVVERRAKQIWADDRGLVYETDDDEHVYEVDVDGLYMPRERCIFPFQGGFLVLPDALYTLGSGKLTRIPRDDSPSTTFDATGTNTASSLVADATFFYWLDANRIQRMGRDGSQLTTLPPMADFGSLAVTGTRIFWADTAGNAGSSDHDGGDVRSFALGGGLSSLVADDTRVYWASGGAIRVASSPDASDARTIASVSASAEVTGFALNATGLYWAETTRTSQSVSTVFWRACK